MLSLFPSLQSTPLLWLQISSVAIWLSFIFLAWGVSRFAHGNPEVNRKIVHIGTGNIILLAWWFDIPASIGIGCAIVASGVTLLSYRLPILPGINSVGRRSLGTFFYDVNIGILIDCFWYLKQPQYAALGIMVMAWGDGLAALIGQRFGQHKYQILGAEKSWEGSLTMFLASFTVILLILIGVQGNFWQTWVISLVVAVVATGLESFSLLGIDNLTVPLGSAALAFMLVWLMFS